MAHCSAVSYEPDPGLTAKALRRLTQWRTAKPLGKRPASSIITFTFDDFPRSAADTGAEIVESAGGKATYYACSGIVGQEHDIGHIYTPDDLAVLQAAGHEIGAHTHSHIDCWRTPRDQALADIDRNVNELRAMGVTAPVSQFAYPYGETEFTLKLALSRKFRGARGVLAGTNGGRADLMQLRALELDTDPAKVSRALAAIDASARNPQWVILFTHDVSDRPSPYGVKAADLRAIARRARDSRADVLTMTQALDRLDAGSN